MITSGSEGFGSTPRTLPDVREHGINNWDLSLFKNFAITERFTLQLRGEMFNARLAEFPARTGARLDPADVGLFVVCSCTGYVTPGLDILLARDLGYVRLKAGLSDPALVK